MTQRNMQEKYKRKGDKYNSFAVALPPSKWKIIDAKRGSTPLQEFLEICMKNNPDKTLREILHQEAAQ